MKKLIASLVALSVGLAGGITYAVTQDEKVAKDTTEYVMIQSEADAGYLNAKPIQEDSQLEHGYILDDEYEIGDIVEITYNNDDLVSERKVTGKELMKIHNDYEKEINAVVEEGVRLDGMTVSITIDSEHKDWANGTGNDGLNYVVEGDKVDVGDVVQATVNLYGEIIEMEQMVQTEDGSYVPASFYE